MSDLKRFQIPHLRHDSVHVLWELLSALLLSLQLQAVSSLEMSSDLDHLMHIIFCLFITLFLKPSPKLAVTALD